MTVESLLDKVNVVGIGATPQGKLPEYDGDDIAIWALREAIKDSGLKKEDIDGLLVQRSFGGGGEIREIGHRLGMEPRYAHNVDSHGNAVHHATMLLATGLCNTVAIMYGTNQRTNRNKFTTSSYHGGGNFDEVYGLSNPGAVAALNYRRRMKDYGATEYQLGAIAVAQAKGASLNPLAVYRDTFTQDEYMDFRYVIAPLRLVDFSMVSDGGFAMILTTRERARDLPKPGPTIMAMGAQASFLEMSHPDAMYHPSQPSNAKMLWGHTDIKHDDINALYIQDAYTPNVFAALENYGFCERGTAHEWAQGGRLELGSSMPVNCHGGQNRLSYMVGWHNTYDAVTQLRNEAQTRERQIPNANTVMVTVSGGHWEHTYSMIYQNAM